MPSPSAPSPVMPRDPRAREAWLVERCALAAQQGTAPADPLEASVFDLAAMVLPPDLQAAASRLHASAAAFRAQQGEPLIGPAELVRQGAVIGLPRFRQQLSARLRVA